MRALSVRQPYAGAILSLGKDVENRSRRMGVVGETYLIHASAAPAPPFAVTEVENISKAEVPIYGLPGESAAWATGAICGAVDLVGLHRHDRDTGCEGTGRMCSPWALDGQWHLQLARPRVLTRRIPAQGRLGLWTPDDVTLDEVRRRWPR